MKLVSWAIIFVIVVFAFAFSIRINMNNKMDIMQEEVKYNNILDQATMDATQVLAEQLDVNSENEKEIILTAMQRFIDSFSISMGYYGGKNSTIKQYIPAIITTVYDGFYVYSIDELIENDGRITNDPSYIDHTLKPKIPYSFIERVGENNILINFTLDNYITVVSEKYKGEGYVVDLRHQEAINNSGGLKIEEIGSDYRYEESFMNYNGKRVLLEEWYENTSNNLIYRRISPYSVDAYNFTKKLKEVIGDDNNNHYLINGNPENTGFVNPITKEYEIGDFHKKRREIITNAITEKLKYYVSKHNKVARNYDITYQFVLPVIQSTDWNNALDDVSVIAFVQGIPIMGKTYYNNYGFSNAKIVEKEVFYAFDGESGKIYFSSRQLNAYTNYVLSTNPNVTMYYTAEEAAKQGYFPYVGQQNEYINNTINEANLNVEYNVTYNPTSAYSQGGRIINLNIKGGALITYVSILQGKKNKSDFYNNNLADNIANSLNDEISLELDENNNAVTTINIELASIFNTDSGAYTILIKDLEGRTKLIKISI